MTTYGVVRKGDTAIRKCPQGDGTYRYRLVTVESATRDGYVKTYSFDGGITQKATNDMIFLKMPIVSYSPISGAFKSLNVMCLAMGINAGATQYLQYADRETS